MNPVHKYDDPTTGAWHRFLAARDSGSTVEIDEEMYYYWLEALPPVFMGKYLPFPEPQHPMRYNFGFAEGEELVTVFWCSISDDGNKKRYYCRRTPFLPTSARTIAAATTIHHVRASGNEGGP